MKTIERDFFSSCVMKCFKLYFKNVFGLWMCLLVIQVHLLFSRNVCFYYWLMIKAYENIRLNIQIINSE